MAALTAEALRSLDFAASATKAAWDVASTAASTAASTGAAATELTVSAVTTANYVKQGGAALTAAEVQAVKSVGQAGGAMAGAVLKVAGGIVSAAVGIWDITAGIWGLVQGHGHQAMMEKINKACDAVLHQCHYVVVNDPRAVQVQQDVESLRTWIREFDWHCGVHNGWQNGTKVFSGVAGVASGVLLLLAPFTFGATLIPSAIVGGVAFTTSITNVIASGFVNADHARQLQEKLDALNRSMDGVLHGHLETIRRWIQELGPRISAEVLEFYETDLPNITKSLLEAAAGSPQDARECRTLANIGTNRLTLTYRMVKGRGEPNSGEPPRGDMEELKRKRFPRWYRGHLYIDDSHRYTTPWYDNYEGLEREMVQLDRGHVVPRRLGGSGDIANLFAQNRHQNRGAWRREERHMVDMIRGAPPGAKIEWIIEIHLEESILGWWIDYFRGFFNTFSR